MRDNNCILYDYIDIIIGIISYYSFLPFSSCSFFLQRRWQVHAITNHDIPRFKVIFLVSRVYRKDAEERKRERRKFSRWFFIRISSQRNRILLGGMEPEQAMRGGNCEVEVGTLPQYCSWITFSTRYSSEGRKGGRAIDHVEHWRYYVSASSFFALLICPSVCPVIFAPVLSTMRVFLVTYRSGAHRRVSPRVLDRAKTTDHN